MSAKGQLRIFAREGSTKKDASDILNRIFAKYCMKDTQGDGRHVTPMYVRRIGVLVLFV